LIRKFKIAGHVVTFFKGARANKNIIRAAIINTPNNRLFKMMSARTKLSVGKIRAYQVKEFTAKAYTHNQAIAGAVAGGGLKKKVFINLSTHKRVKAMSGSSHLRNTINHELFHTTPVIGGSEIGAHFWGGLHSVKNKLSFKAGINDVKRFAKHRPDEYKREVGTIIRRTAIAGASAASGTYVFRRIRGRVVRIKVKNGDNK